MFSSRRFLERSLVAFHGQAIAEPLRMLASGDGFDRAHVVGLEHALAVQMFETKRGSLPWPEGVDHVVGGVAD